MSHLDVVPATNDLGSEWLYEPFAGAYVKSKQK
jgi:hypothetical protein